MTVGIVRKRGVLGGRPIIAGTRIGVDIIGNYIIHGYGVADIRHAYPHLTDAQIAAALSYLDDQTRQEIGKLAKTAA
ncbi:MAG: DUF433 domain-containing protein [Candidatus Berkelbacteria bacterium]|nr:DUF433 domain-containing protein [Candidatus Berkelbacteria bacterium]